jgi:hypothetical protein
VTRGQAQARALSTVDNNAPFRNTRSRSRSLEPASSKKGARSRRKETSALPVIHDVIEILGDDEAPAPVGETVREERDVAEQLFENDRSTMTIHEQDEIIATRSSRSQRGVRQRIGESVAQRLDSDDEQVANNLRASRNRSPSSGEESGVVAQLQEFHASLRFSPGQGRKQADGASPTRVTRKATGQQSAAVPQSRKGQRSESSTNTAFPAPGTRASTMRDQLEAEEKFTPFTPLPGTRASKRVRK